MRNMPIFHSCKFSSNLTRIQYLIVVDFRNICQSRVQYLRILVWWDVWAGHKIHHGTSNRFHNMILIIFWFGSYCNWLLGLSGCVWRKVNKWLVGLLSLLIHIAPTPQCLARGFHDLSFVPTSSSFRWLAGLYITIAW